ncbi:CCA tRNA nucleotidyltransferase [Candidatus Peregrinibacteria bacterium]|nr:MAG: CCA tRNA nucleotidyltransferase [Candidatus Peregrinibacteria bacterium]
MDMEKTATAICKKLQNAGFEAFFAGGAVRDLLIQKTPKDIDIATNARPEEMEKLFGKTFATGKNFGVLLIEEGGYHFEVATFRNDIGSSDGRRPDAIHFSKKEEDAFRRDFTVNALFWDPIAKKLYDFVNGEQDIHDRVLRFVGDPEERIQEDFLRILRAVRFKNTLGFSYESLLKEAIQKHASLTGQISAERVRQELTKMLSGVHRSATINDLAEFGILPVVLPEIDVLRNISDSHRNRTVFEHTLSCLSFLPENTDSILAWAILFHDTGKAITPQKKYDRIHFPKHEKESEKIAKKVTKRLAFSRFETDKIAWLCREHIPFYGVLNMTRAHRLHFYDHPFFEDLLQLCRCDALGDDGNDNLVQRIQEDYENAREKRLLPQFHPDLLSGKEIMDIAKVEQGKQVGVLKHRLREAQILGEIHTKKEAEEWIRERKSF